MSNSEIKSVALILFWWNVAIMRGLPEEIVKRLEGMWTLYFNFRDREEALKIAPATLAAVEDNLDGINEAFLRNDIQDDNIGVFSMLYFFAEFFHDTSNNATRRARWRDLLEAIQSHPLQEEINATQDYDYLNRAEQCFADINNLLARVDIKHYMRNAKPIMEAI